MRAIASSCAPGTADRWRLRWRYLGLIIINTALWGGVIWGVAQWLS
jgi:hypothetical protein